MFVWACMDECLCLYGHVCLLTFCFALARFSPFPNVNFGIGIPATLPVAPAEGDGGDTDKSANDWPSTVALAIHQSFCCCCFVLSTSGSLLPSSLVASGCCCCC